MGNVWGFIGHSPRVPEMGLAVSGAKRGALRHEFSKMRESED